MNGETDESNKIKIVEQKFTFQMCQTCICDIVEPQIQPSQIDKPYKKYFT